MTIDIDVDYATFSESLTGFNLVYWHLKAGLHESNHRIECLFTPETRDREGQYLASQRWSFRWTAAPHGDELCEQHPCSERNDSVNRTILRDALLACRIGQ